MTTMKRFRPQNQEDKQLDKVFTTFFEHQKNIKSRILKARERDVTGKKFASAIGPLVQFNVPECLEFVISHEERHVLQCEEVLQELGIAEITTSSSAQ